MSDELTQLEEAVHQQVLKRMPALDGLRGIAVTAVIVTHTFLVVASTGSNAVDRVGNLAVRSIGPLGVDLFFVLSGFLITSILDATRESTHPFRTFYARRALRIVPLYYVYLVLVPLLFAGWGKIAIGTWATRLWDLLFLTNIAMTQHSPEQLGFLFGHFWSLAIEEHFYLLWPLAILLVPRSRLPAFCAAIFLFSFAGRIALTILGHAHYGWLLMPFRMDGLAAGAFVALKRSQNRVALDRASRNWRNPIALCLPGLIAILMVMFWRSGVTLPASFDTRLTARKLEIVFSPMVGAIVFALAVARVAGNDGIRSGFLKNPVLGKLGKYSYGMYLFHAPIVVLLFLVPKHPKPAGLDLPFQIVASAVVVGLSLLAGATTWHLLEQRCLRLAPDYRYSTTR